MKYEVLLYILFSANLKKEEQVQGSNLCPSG